LEEYGRTYEEAIDHAEALRDDPEERRAEAAWEDRYEDRWEM